MSHRLIAPFVSPRLARAPYALDHGPEDLALTCASLRLEVMPERGKQHVKSMKCRSV